MGTIFSNSYTRIDIVKYSIKTVSVWRLACLKMGSKMNKNKIICNVSILLLSIMHRHLWMLT